ncbi:MAG: recombination protein NinB [Burkholderiales bacterium]
MQGERVFILDTPAHRDNAVRYVARLPVEDGVLELVVRPYIARRSLTQNARLWALHTKAAEVTGYSAEEMHEFALMRHFGTREIQVGGITRTVPLKRSSTRDRKEFAAFMEATEAWYIDEFGVWLEADAG